MTRPEPAPETLLTPNELLAREVRVAFEQVGYLRPDDLGRFETNLAAGTLTAEDWTLLAENALLTESEAIEGEP